MTFALSQSAALLLLFIVLPLILAPLVIWFVASRGPEVPVAHRTSVLLEHGDAATAEVVSWKNKGQLLDREPMVAFTLDVETDAARERFRLELTQPVPKWFLASLAEGMSLDVRVSTDRTAGAVVVPRPS